MEGPPGSPIWRGRVFELTWSIPSSTTTTASASAAAVPVPVVTQIAIAGGESLNEQAVANIVAQNIHGSFVGHLKQELAEQLKPQLSINTGIYDKAGKAVQYPTRSLRVASLKDSFATPNTSPTLLNPGWVSADDDRFRIAVHMPWTTAATVNIKVSTETAEDPLRPVSGDNPLDPNHCDAKSEIELVPAGDLGSGMVSVQVLATLGLGQSRR